MSEATPSARLTSRETQPEASTIQRTVVTTQSAATETKLETGRFVAPKWRFKRYCGGMATIQIKNVSDGAHTVSSTRRC
jgi:hypothetical protein